ncbi:transcription antitermination factor NusB [Stappia sp. ES.058]|uniref:transcription antitermination factor NusB n=1 Tax=Stappia sp. ES.058 TaxID=1881061 RepID=UPI00087B7144|nr:transcription antitermination factor NusB [Stappia sp. ES.058]SDU06269.1 NusB antitermination factor [Stappia sp. ES.058]
MSDPTPAAADTPRPANKRGAARLSAVQALYQMDVGGANLADVLAEFEAYRLGAELDGEQYREADPAWFRDLVSGVVDQQRTLDPEINRALVAGWPLKRIDTTLRAILRAGTLELMKRKDVPARVVLSEYIDVARAFYDGDEPRMVNGVLDRLAREFREKEFSGQASAKETGQGVDPNSGDA